MAKILVAEDEITSSQILVSTIEKMGHTVFVSPNGRHAHETMIANPDINLMITDVMMPELDGRELVSLLRKVPKFKKLPIIVISAYVGPKEIAHLLQEGATWFLGKPLKPAEIREYVQRACRQSGIGREPERRDKSEYEEQLGMSAGNS